MSSNILGFLLPLFIIIWCSEVKAQRVIVVCDLETHTPLRDVHVVTKTNYRDTTDYTGTLHLPVVFEEATFMRYGYLAYTVKQENLTDTIMLLPSMNTLREVQVWGKDLRVEDYRVCSRVCSLKFLPCHALSQVLLSMLLHYSTGEVHATNDTWKKQRKC